MTTTTKEVIRTAWNGCYEIVNDTWGTRLQQTYDPEGVDISDEELTTFELRDDFARLPNKLLNQIISFFSEFQIESQVILVRKENDLCVWDALVPRQQNTSGSCSSDKKDLISLTTDLTYNDTPEGWVESGSIHSHPQMQAFWSSVDDASELKWTGVHFTIGGDWKTKTFTICTSICIGGNRYVFPPNVLVEGDFAQKTKNGNEYLIIKPTLYKTPETVKAYVTQKVYVPKVAKTGYVGWSKHQYNDVFYSDPFHVSEDYNSLRLRSFDKDKKSEKVKDAITNYLFDGGDAQTLREFITEIENELFTLYNF